MRQIENKSKAIVTFSEGQVPGILKQMEEFLELPLSLRSTSGDVVVKTDYFYGPCSLIRSTEQGRVRCRKLYKTIEERLFRRKVPLVTFCYAGFLVFSVPLDFRGEMLGTIFGSQVLPIQARENEARNLFAPICRELEIENQEMFFQSFQRIRHLSPDFERVSFLQFLEKLGENFIEMAFTGKVWASFYREMVRDFPLLEQVRKSR